MRLERSDIRNPGVVTPTASAQIALDNAADGLVLSHRQRVVIADVNAGKEILPAIADQSYRVTNVIMIAYGGAVGTVTTIDILGTQGASSVKLVAFAQASLTENTVLQMGDSGAAVLAAGASYVTCDENTAITVDISGSDADTATGVDIIINYVIE